MPAAKLGGYNFRDLMAGLSINDGVSVDKIQEAIELMFTEDPKAAARLLREVMHLIRQNEKIHTYLHSNDVEDAREYYLKEIKPALTSGKGSKTT